MSAPQWGHVAEWLRSGLQNRLHQFNSGRGLQSNQLIYQLFCSRLQRSIDHCRRSSCIPGMTWL